MTSAVSKGSAVSRALDGLLGAATEKRVQAIKTLEGFAKNPEERSDIIASGGAKLIVSLLGRPGDQVMPHEKIRLVNTLASLAVAPACRTVIVNADAVAPLIRLLGGQLETTQEAAATALTSLTPQKGCPNSMVEEGVMDTLAALLKVSAGDKVKTRGCELMASVLQGESKERLSRAKAAIDSGAVLALVPLLAVGESDEVLIQAAKAMSYLPSDNATRKTAVEGGAFHALLELLVKASDEVKEQALQGIASIIKVDAFEAEEDEEEGDEVPQEDPSQLPGVVTPPDIEELLACGLLPQLVSLLLGPTSEIRHYAVYTFFQLAARGDIQAQLLAAAPLPALVSLMKDGKDAETRAWSISSLRLLATSAEHREAIERSVPMFDGREQLMAKIRKLCF